MIIGFNILLFDRFPCSSHTLSRIDKLENIFKVFKKIFWKDLRYCLLPLNNFSFAGLSAEEIATKLKIRSPKHSNKDTHAFYDQGENDGGYNKIIEHIETEMRFLSDLSFKMRELDAVRKLLQQK